MRADMILSSPKSRFRMWLKAVGGSFIFALLIIFFIFFRVNSAWIPVEVEVNWW